MFAVIVRFQQLTSYLSPLSGYFGQIDGGQNSEPSLYLSTSQHKTLKFYHIIWGFILAALTRLH
jgi:hypothetical protein